jgi:pimeloyl-ACP methyl ester carboxylesterase
MSDAVNYAFLHGGGQGGWVWTPTIDALKRLSAGAENRFFALDVPGCGSKRGRYTDSLDADDVAGELIADLESAALRDVVLVGHSQAGNVIPNMVRLRPALFRHLVYISCSIPLPGQTVIEMMGAGVHGSSVDQVGWSSERRAADMRERYQAAFCNDMNAAGRAAFTAQLGQDRWPMSTYENRAFAFDLPVQLPATYLICLRDGILPVNWQETFATRLHASRLIRIDAGHQVMTTRPEMLAQILRHVLMPS